MSSINKVGKFTVRTIVEVYAVNITIYTYFDSSDHVSENGAKYQFKHFTRTQSKAIGRTFFIFI